MTYDRRNYSGIQGQDQKTPKLTTQQLQDNPSIDYKINATNQLFRKTYYPNSEPVEGFAMEESFPVSIEDLGSIYNLHQLVIQFSMMLKANGTEMPKFVQAVRVLHTKDRIGTSLESLKLTEDNTKKKTAESTYTLCFYWDAASAVMAKIPKNAFLQFYFVDYKKEYGLIWNSNFIQLGNFTGTPNPSLDKFNGTVLTNYGIPGTFGMTDYSTTPVDSGNCNPYKVQITPDNYIICGTSQDKERKINVHPSAPVCNYKNPAFSANGFRQFGAGKEFRKPNYLVTHWDVCHNTYEMFNSLESKGYSMAFGVDRDGMIFQFANGGQEVGGAANFAGDYGTIGCEVNNPVVATDGIKSRNIRCFGDEDGGRRRIPTAGFKFPNGATVSTAEYIYDFLDPQYFSVGALWEACAYAYDIPLKLPDDSWIDWRPQDASPTQPHPLANDTNPNNVKKSIKDRYRGIIFHHNIDWAVRNGKLQSGKWDIVILDRKRFLQYALQCRADRNAGKF